MNAIQPEEKAIKPTGMKLYTTIILPLLIFTTGLLPAQTTRTKTLEGRISYISMQNTYVSFPSTEGISKGDTLYFRSNDILLPALVVTQLSSISCVTKPLNSIEPELNAGVVAIATIITEAAKIKAVKPKPDTRQLVREKEADKRKEKQRIYGRLAIASYSNFSNTAANNNQRMRYTLSLRGDNLGGSRISMDSYISFSHRSGEWDRISENIFNGLKIYSLALKYDITDNTHIWLGRKINSHVSNIGAMDGIQAQTRVKNFTFGIAGGTRPDYTDYSINTDLFQFGGFVAHQFKTETGNASSSLALFEQKNGSMTDRRFAYFQHSNSLLKNLNVFASCELDLYKLENDQPVNTLNLTGLYLSFRYRPWRKVSLFTSYDARKNVIYFETYKNLADRILENETRQGYRFQVLLRPFNYFTASLRAGYRFRKSDPSPTNNASAYITYSKVPWLNGTAALNVTMLNTSYLNGLQYALNLSRDFCDGKLYSRLNFRVIDYNFTNSPTGMFQKIGELSLNYRMLKTLQLTATYEATLEDSNLFNRVYFGIIKRFK